MAVGGGPWQDLFAAAAGDARRLDNREIVSILRRALMDLMVDFQAIERQVNAAPGGRATSNRS